MIQRTHLLARGVIFRGPAEVLIAKARGHSHSFLQGTPTDYEVNHIFRAEIDASRPLEPREPHLTFSWCPVADLDAVQLEPKPLRALIREYVAGGDKSPWWASNVETPTE